MGRWRRSLHEGRTLPVGVAKNRFLFYQEQAPQAASTSNIAMSSPSPKLGRSGRCDTGEPAAARPGRGCFAWDRLPACRPKRQAGSLSHVFRPGSCYALCYGSSPRSAPDRPTGAIHFDRAVARIWLAALPPCATRPSASSGRNAAASSQAAFASSGRPSLRSTTPESTSPGWPRPGSTSPPAATSTRRGPAWAGRGRPGGPGGRTAAAGAASPLPGLRRT